MGNHTHTPTEETTRKNMGGKPTDSLPGRLPLVTLPKVHTVTTAALAVILRTTTAQMPAIAVAPRQRCPSIW